MDAIHAAIATVVDNLAHLTTSHRNELVAQILASAPDKGKRSEMVVKACDHLDDEAFADMVVDWLGFVDSKSPHAERIADRAAYFLSKTAINDMVEDWATDSENHDKLFGMTLDQVDEPLPPEPFAELLNKMPSVFRDQWFSRFIDNLNTHARSDLGAYWHG